MGETIHLFKDIHVGDILKYEETEDVDILSEIEQGELYIILDLVAISNRCNKDDALIMFEKALENYDLDAIIEKLIDCLIGKQCKKDDDHVDHNNFKNFSEILLTFYRQIQCVDTLSWGDFTSMTVRQLYNYADGIQERYIINKNEELQSQYNNACITGGVIFGSLKECPQLDKDGHIKQKSLYEKLMDLKKR